MTEPAPPHADSVIILYTTLPTEKDAVDLGRSLVDERLAGCVNISPNLTSIYRWQDAIETASETALFIKTTAVKQELVHKFIADRHPYTTPILMTIRPETVNAAYVEWLRNSLGSD